MGGSEIMTSISCHSWRVRPAYGWSAYRPSIVYAKKKNVSVVAYNSNDIIGAEYGEGFMKFHPTGEKTQLDVDTLNEDLKLRGAHRMRHLMHPDEAYGLIFDFDNVIVDALSLRKNAWRKVASNSGLKLPAIERPNMYSLIPEKAVMDVLRWTDDIRRAKDLSWQLSQAYIEEISQNSQLRPGVEKWLKSMQEFHVPCALVSTLGRDTLQGVLKRLGIFDKFSAIGAADDDMETKAQQYLSAAISISRPPEQCVVFGASPEAIAAAHNCTMRAVAVIGPCTAPQLRSADLTVASLDELSVYNIRRLFANRGNEFMDLKKKFSKGDETKRKLRHGTST